MYEEQALSEPMDRGRRPRVLMLTHRVPCPPDRGDRIRAYHQLCAMAGRFEVTLATVADEPVSDASLAELGRLTDRLLMVKARPMHRRAAAARAMLTGRAITPAAMLDRSLVKQLLAIHRDRPFDTVFTYCTGMIGYTQALREDERSPGFRHVLDLVDVDSEKWLAYAESASGPMRLVYLAEARRLRAVEAGRVVPFDELVVISPAEARRYRESVSTEHEPVVVGNGVDLERFSPAPALADEPVLIMTGVMSYKPNVDAAAWFARRVMPRVRAAVPVARFDIVGKSPAPQVKALGELPGVRVVGPVDSTADSLRASAVAVAPMRIAPGVQNKVLEAMACGLPVVCSAAAAGGIDAEPGVHLVVAGNEADTAAACAQLLMHPAERQRLGEAARRRVASHYDWPGAVAPLLDLLEPSMTTTTASPA